MEFLKQAVIRTKGRFIRLGESVVSELENAHDEFSMHGCPLTFRDINKRSANVATIFSLLLVGVTLPIIVYYRGLSEMELYFGLLLNFFFGWTLFYLLVMTAHGLWVFSYIIGSKIGKSGIFWGFIEKRWTKSIDKITEELLVNKSVDINDHSADVLVPVHTYKKKGDSLEDEKKSEPKPQLQATDEEEPTTSPVSSS
ncbi:hypothetical protein Ocin01_08074 [Orchesella cincta]|uniref:Uncharacterized protein n=1 Tax=Orchesella cincta TaxID=48709 RepID=A0A1D2MZZ2_ORCCI|nr:hypothetical protein Ocin01_08074 [Orchesella cincta]